MKSNAREHSDPAVFGHGEDRADLFGVDHLCLGGCGDGAEQGG